MPYDLIMGALGTTILGLAGYIRFLQNSIVGDLKLRNQALEARVQQLTDELIGLGNTTARVADKAVSKR